MTVMKSLMVGAALALAAGAAWAQMPSSSTSGSQPGGSTSSGSMSGGSMSGGSMSGGSMSGDAMSSSTTSTQTTSTTMRLSAMDKKTLSACQDMDRDAMMAAAKCKRLQAKHPGLFAPDGAIKGGNSTPH